MRCAISLAGIIGLVCSTWFSSVTLAEGVTGKYLEARTCQVYTGPCFANAEVGLAGKEAILAWSIDKGTHDDIDLAGLSVVMVVSASDTLGFDGLDDPREMKSVILVDQTADDDQRAALISFAKQRGGRAGKSVVRVQCAPIEMSLDTAELNGKLQVGKVAKLVTRKARPDDCICSNESAYYPPLAKVENFAPGVTIDGGFSGRGLGSRWSIPGSRSAYMATFSD